MRISCRESDDEYLKTRDRGGRSVADLVASSNEFYGLDMHGQKRLGFKSENSIKLSIVPELAQKKRFSPSALSILNFGID